MMTAPLEDHSPPHHIPVMVEEVLRWLAPQSGDRVLDLTVGEGGHARAILPFLEPSGVYLGIDRDPQALACCSEFLHSWHTQGILRLSCSPFAPMASYLHLLEGERPDKILADLGMSSLQLDLPERGFSFHYPDAPLDLRMNPEEGVPAWQYLQDMDLRSLILLLREIGGLRDPRPVALQLKNNLPRTMGELREVLASYRFREKRGNLENRVLLALRVALNQELELLYALLVELPFYAKPGSRVVFLTYHSAEDHLVKWAFRAYARGELPPPPPFLKILMGKDLPVDPISWYESWVEKEKGSFSPSFSKKSFPPGRILTPKPLFPTPEEIARNPRSHSAHLRAFQFGEAMR